jgi:hypothetical protein
MMWARQENAKRIVKNRKSLPIRLQCCHGRRFRGAMVVFDLEQTHVVRRVTIVKPEKWKVNYKRNSDDLLIWLNEGKEGGSCMFSRYARVYTQSTGAACEIRDFCVTGRQ